MQARSPLVPTKPLIQRLYGLSRPLRRRHMRRFLSRFPKGEILDVGGNASTWKGWDREVTVVNASGPRVWEDRPARFILADARDLEFADGAFDIVYCNSVIEHLGTLSDQAKLAAEVRRVGRRSGEYMDGKVAELGLVSKRELRTLFPDASIDRERVLGLTKSWIAVRNDKATSAAKRYP